MATNWKDKLYHVVFKTDTPGGRQFDIVLLWVILASVIVVVLESIPAWNQQYGRTFFIIESFFTALFTIEYLLRILVYPKPAKYIFSYWGIIDFLAFMPFYLSAITPDYHYLLVLRLLRMVRVFRILKLFRFIKESQQLYSALKASIYKIGVFLSFILTLIVILGTIMYAIEGPSNGFTSIPQSIYWTVVTITTVGYGDVTPQTVPGKVIATIIMLCGYAIIAVPTGIVTAEISRQSHLLPIKCKQCGHVNPVGSNFCNFCGQTIEEDDEAKTA